MLHRATWPPKREASALTLVLSGRMCVCMSKQAAAFCLSTQENFNLPVDPCDGAIANL